MTKSHQSAVVVSPPPGDWHTIQSIRKQYDRNFRRWMPHITLPYPFYAKEHFDEGVLRLQEACQKTRAFDLTFSQFSSFQHGRKSFTLWLAPEPGEAVGALQEALWKSAPDCDETRKHSEGFTPHLSVGQLRSRQEIDAVLPSLQASWEALTVRVEKVDLIWRNDKPDDVFRVGYAIALETGEIQRVNM
jgi:poly(A) polymerase